MLGVITHFLTLIEENKIPYVQWKSNERISLFLEGEGDLDLLFYEENKKEVEQIFRELNAKKFEAIPVGKYSNIEDYLVLDRVTARIVHFHVHFQLDLGEPGIKRYNIPWIHEVIGNRIRHETEPIWTPSYEHELFLLIIREALRIPPIKATLASWKHRIELKSLGEFTWLKKRVNRQRFEKITRALLGDEAMAVVNIYDEGLYESSVRKLRHILAPLRKKYRTLSDSGTLALLLKNKLNNTLKKTLRIFGIFWPKKRINPREGLVVVVTGSDGSGKSSTIKVINEIFSRKLDVEVIYLGLPKPEKSRNPIFIKAIYFIKLKRYWNLLVKWVRIRKVFKMKQYGMMVLCDRFPQAQYPGFMDGPLAANWLFSKNPLKKWFSRVELEIFQSFQSMEIDLVIKLDIDPQTSHARGLLPLETATKKTQIVKDLKFPGAGEIQTIDTVKNNLIEVVNMMMNNIWEKIK